ncbi:MAG: 30S ribosomal protein S16 [bacterium]|nr:30S ribosomal protein S16 [bacterium]
MLAIKLRRIGKKHQPAFRVIVNEKKSKVSGKFLDDLGWVNPLSHKFELDKEKAKHWLSVGAQPTTTVHNLLVKTGVLTSPKIAIKMKAGSNPKEGENVSGSAPAVKSE